MPRTVPVGIHIHPTLPELIPAALHRLKEVWFCSITVGCLITYFLSLILFVIRAPLQYLQTMGLMFVSFPFISMLPHFLNQ